MSVRFWENKRVLVAGGAGFIGSHAVDALIARGAKVAVVDNLSTGRQENINPKARFYNVDTNSVPAMERVFRKERPEFVLNFAALAHVPHSIKDPLLDAKSIIGLINLLHKAVRYKTRKMFHASSGFIYGNPRRYPTPETQPFQPLNPYSVSKAACEHYLKFFNWQYGLPYVALRYSTVYGPRRVEGAIPYYLRSIISGQPAEMYGLKSRDLIFVSDAADAALSALEKNIPAPEPVFNIGSGREIELAEVHSTIAKLLGKPDAKLRRLPGRAGEVERFYLDIRKAKRVLGFRPRVSLESGLQKTIDWFMKEQWSLAGRTHTA